jgi:hypothetical protein
MNPDSSMKSPVKELNDPLADVDEANESMLFPFLSASGLYATPGIIPGLSEDASCEVDGDESVLGFPTRPLPTPLPLSEELRLDVDGRYPLLTASGTIVRPPFQRQHWIAKLQKVAPNTYTGGIWYKSPADLPFAYTNVKIIASPNFLPANRKATVTFSGPGLADRTRVYRFRSRYFHKVEFEFDCDAGITPVLSIGTGNHPNRPSTLPVESLSVQAIYNRAGFDVATSGAASIIPGAPGTTWSDAEMHDAMQTYWSRFANAPQWAMWVLLAKRHDAGASLGGIMFDDIGANHRQGTAVFYDSFISDVPAGDPAPGAFQARMRLWTAVHEMGHAFNLAHSWQKSLGSPWIPLVDEPEARSFMNYPFAVAGGQSAFFSSFEYRFSNSELLFMRHAPSQFVRMGDAPWFSNHGFRAPNAHPDPALQLTLRFNRGRASFEFLEPIVAELKLKNVSNAPVLVDESALQSLDRVTIAMIRQGGAARQYLPYSRQCLQPNVRALQPGESVYASAFLSAGLNGFDLAEPGHYLLQAAFHTNAGDIVSAPVVLRVAAPKSGEEEEAAVDFYTDAVGRALHFDGTRYATESNEANDVLRNIIDKLGGLRVATHARVALAMPKSRDYKGLVLPAGTEEALRAVAQIGTTKADQADKISTAKIQELPAELDQAKKLLQPVLATDVAAETLSHIDYKGYVDTWCDTLNAQGQQKAAAKAQDDMYQVLSARGVSKGVLEEVEERRDGFAKATGA